MSRIGKQPITIPAQVQVTINDAVVSVVGPQGSLSLSLPNKISVEIKDNQIIVSRQSNDKQTKANHGTTRAHLQNMVSGVVTPWKKELEVRGTGYKAVVSGDKLVLTVGFIHPVTIPAPAGIKIQVAEDTKITVTGCDKTVVGQTASTIRKVKKPEPYKGKGIRYLNEFIKLKAGKTAKA